jgi:putative selenate reductase
VQEASRCLDCDDLCSLCVTVCPNRANHAYTMVPFRLDLPLLVQRGGRLVAEGERTFAVDQTVQTLNVADFCNECGNCATFCPTAGAPYKDKPRFWMDREGYLEATGDAFRLERGPAGLVVEARLGGREHRLVLGDGRAEYRAGQVRATLSGSPWRITAWETTGVLAEGTPVDLAPCATLLVLACAGSTLPEGILAVR